MNFLIGLFIFFGFIALCIWLDCKSEKKDRLKAESNASTWFEEELEKPMYRIRVLTKNGTVYESKAFKPNYEVERWFNWTYLTYTSRELAERVIEQSFKSSRYFHPDTDTYIPMCDVETIKPVQAD